MRNIKCSVPECTNIAVGYANISIKNAKKTFLPLCSMHVDAAKEDVKPLRKLTISAKCSDMFSAILYEDNKQVGNEYSDYVPNWFPNPQADHFGDYVELQIDIDTGQILNWRKPTKAQLNETFKGEENDDE